jgi:murein DD-endopeptidase MepM/ murein hydrolase activator NlpD
VNAQVPYKRILLIALLCLIALPGAGVFAQQQPPISVKYEFQRIPQAAAGLISIAGKDLARGTATVFGREYPCWPNSSGLACLIAPPMTQPVKDYPIVISVTKSDGTQIPWNSTLTVALGQFIAEPFTLPGNLNYLLRDDVQANEDDRLITAYSIITPERYWEGAFTPPINSPTVSPFGSVRTYTNNGAVRRHTGIDFRASVGTPVLASASGRVVLSRPMDIHGNNIVIDHGWGIYTEYAHLSERYVVPGQFVLQGDVIGLSGNTGRSTGPHIHWEVAIAGVWISPLAFAQMKLPQ